jgi:hypothetical protein
MAPDATVLLTARSFSQVPLANDSNDFTFVVGDVSYECGRLIADLLSNKIAKMHISDPSISHDFIESDDPNENFTVFLSLSSQSNPDHNFIRWNCNELNSTFISPTIFPSNCRLKMFASKFQRFM